MCISVGCRWRKVSQEEEEEGREGTGCHPFSFTCLEIDVMSITDVWTKICMSKERKKIETGEREPGVEKLRAAADKRFHSGNDWKSGKFLDGITFSCSLSVYTLPEPSSLICVTYDSSLLSVFLFCISFSCFVIIISRETMLIGSNHRPCHDDHYITLTPS